MAGLQWGDFNQLTLKQLNIVIRKRQHHNLMLSETRSLEHYQAQRNVTRKNGSPYERLYPDLRCDSNKEQYTQPDVSEAIKLLEEVGIDVSTSR